MARRHWKRSSGSFPWKLQPMWNARSATTTFFRHLIFARHAELVAGSSPSLADHGSEIWFRKESSNHGQKRWQAEYRSPAGCPLSAAQRTLDDLRRLNGRYRPAGGRPESPRHVPQYSEGVPRGRGPETALPAVAKRRFGPD